MPETKLTQEARRSLILEALSGVSAIELARRYGVRRQHVHRLVKAAKENADEELAFWEQVSAIALKYRRLR